MILHIDHIGLVARSLDEAQELFLETLGFTWDLYRTPMPNGFYMQQENAQIYFIQVGDGNTQIELLLPRDKVTGMGKWLAKRGPSVHHLAYMVDDVEQHALELIDKGLQRIEMGPNPGAAFFYPRTTMGILTELVDAGTAQRLHRSAVGDAENAAEAMEDFERSRVLAGDGPGDEHDHDHADGQDHGHTHDGPGDTGAAQPAHHHPHAHPH
ncbi:MAG: mce [Ilumatobacteraceae bacterium]|jgi:methylmalonyl-CoA/ethylmalonyl-CoA epimerase|nr:mce [Ilumatobacteraceae bacterium]